MTDNADLRRLAEQMIVDEDVAAILALLNERDQLDFAIDADRRALAGAERRVAALTDAARAIRALLDERDQLDRSLDDRALLEGRAEAAERRVAALEEGLRALDEPLQWLNDHYHKAMVEMPTHLFRRFDKARAALAAAGTPSASADAAGNGSPDTPSAPRTAAGRDLDLFIRHAFGTRVGVRTAQGIKDRILAIEAEAEAEAAAGSGSLDVLRDALVRIGSDPSVPIPVRRQAKEAVRAAIAAGSPEGER